MNTCKIKLTEMPYSVTLPINGISVSCSNSDEFCHCTFSRSEWRRIGITYEFVNAKDSVIFALKFR